MEAYIRYSAEENRFVYGMIGPDGSVMDFAAADELIVGFVEAFLEAREYGGYPILAVIDGGGDTRERSEGSRPELRVVSPMKRPWRA